MLHCTTYTRSNNICTRILCPTNRVCLTVFWIDWHPMKSSHGLQGCENNWRATPCITWWAFSALYLALYFGSAQCPAKVFSEKKNLLQFSVKAHVWHLTPSSLVPPSCSMRFILNSHGEQPANNRVLYLSQNAPWPEIIRSDSQAQMDYSLFGFILDF